MLSFYSSQSRSTRYLHAFPTRRSSDLRIFGEVLEVPPTQRTSVQVHPGRVPTLGAIGLRSEEHTSELQSRGQLVCRLLLEKIKERSNKITRLIAKGFSTAFRLAYCAIN